MIRRAGRRPRASHRALGTGFVVAGLVFAGLGLLSATPAVAASTPQLGIAISNGHTSALVGDHLDYVVTVRNLAATAVRGLRITQTVPPGLHGVSAGEKGTDRPGTITWTAGMAANSSLTFHWSAVVDVTPKNLLRLAAVVCAADGRQVRPLVCATHSDQLAAGAAATAALAAAAPTKTSQRIWDRTAVLIGVGIACTVGASAALFVVHRRRSRRASTEAA
jgi:uncharacterized repeat protein (TIGR01451 family)